ncbi:hypothetical protein LTR05_001135 [Lithohypha guttulata]|uniref:Laccase n=1 Tax=Lithohypha guttulata TaxID=1690604 RepID=A0AAN7YA39_9EURO|nr:hypothetical protein LTR05_001135 [Lithohypha guttulata]
MAFSRFTSAISFLSLATTAFTAPLISTNSANVLERRADGICAAASNCVPFTIDLTWGSVNPTGAGARGAILTNGSFPAPALRLKVGECVDFLVHNHLDVDTGIHFHGIQQTGTPWSDGVPGLSQYAVQPGDSYMYRWTADEQGSYFYHSHYKGQIMDGLYGAIYITPSDGEETPFAAIDSSAVEKLKLADAKAEPIFISDWSKYTFDQFFAIQQAGNVDIACSDAIILNGFGEQYCPTREQITAMTPVQITNLNTAYTNKGCIPANTPQTQGNFTRNLAAIPSDVYDVCTKSSSGKNYTMTVDPADGWAAITLINPGGFALLKATVDNHKLYVYDYNGRYIKPHVVDQVNVANGERVTFFIKLDQQVGDYQIRVANLGLNQIISGFGKISYKGSKGISSTSVAAMTYGGAPLGSVVAFNPAKAAPLVPEAFSRTADKTFKFNLQKLPKSTDAYRWSLQGNTAYDMSNDDGTPLLYKDPATIPESDLVKKTNLGDWVDIIMQTTGPLAQPHPMHKHANKFFVIGQGLGTFNWSTVAEAYAYNASMFNFDSAPYVDGFTTLAGERTSTWTVLRYKVEIAGAWFLHCHMHTHFAGGMAIALLDGVDKWPSVPSDAGKTCQGSASSNSTWNPSCYCAASCAANPGKAADGSGATSDKTAGSSSSGSTSASTSGSGSGSWENGVWTGANSPASSDNTTSYTPSPSTGSYSNSSSSDSAVKTYTGAASASHVSMFTLVALIIAALSL